MLEGKTLHALYVVHAVYVISNHCCACVLHLAMAGWLSQRTLKYMKYPHCRWLLEIGLLQQLSCFKGWEYTYVSHMTRISVVNCAFILVTYVITFVTSPMVKTTWVSLVTTCYAKHVHNNSYRDIDHMQCAIQTYASKFAALLQNLGIGATEKTEKGKQDRNGNGKWEQESVQKAV